MSKPIIELIKCESGEWEILKYNWDIYYEGHSIPDYIWINLLKALDCNAEEMVISDEDMERGRYL